MFDSTETVTNTSDNTVDTLRKDVDPVLSNAALDSTLSVIRREVQKRMLIYCGNKHNQDAFNKYRWNLGATSSSNRWKYSYDFNGKLNSTNNAALTWRHWTEACSNWL